MNYVYATKSLQTLGTKRFRLAIYLYAKKCPNQPKTTLHKTVIALHNKA